MRKILFGVLIAVAASAGAIVSGLQVHNHSSASLGGSTITAGSVAATAGAAPSLATSRIHMWQTGDQVLVDLVNATRPVDSRIMNIQRAGDAIRFRTVNDAYSAATNLLSIFEAGSVELTATLSSTKACAAGYTRTGPNLCLNTTGHAGPGSGAGACAAVTLPDAGAKALVYEIKIMITTNNAVGSRNGSVRFADINTCSVLNEVAHAEHLYHEYTACVNCVHGQWSGQLLVPVPAGGLWMVGSHNGGASTQLLQQLVGYYD